MAEELPRYEPGRIVSAPFEQGHRGGGGGPTHAGERSVQIGRPETRAGDAEATRFGDGETLREGGGERLGMWHPPPFLARGPETPLSTGRFGGFTPPPLPTSGELWMPQATRMGTQLARSGTR